MRHVMVSLASGPRNCRRPQVSAVQGGGTDGRTLSHWQLRQSFGCATDAAHHLLPQSFFLSFLVWESRQNLGRGE